MFVAKMRDGPSLGKTDFVRGIVTASLDSIMTKGLTLGSFSQGQKNLP
jgi:hypothetical protein